MTTLTQRRPRWMQQCDRSELPFRAGYTAGGRQQDAYRTNWRLRHPRCVHGCEQLRAEFTRVMPAAIRLLVAGDSIARSRLPLALSNDTSAIRGNSTGIGRSRWRAMRAWESLLTPT